MQQQAHLAFDTQVLLGALTDTLPANVQRATVDVAGLREKLASGAASTASLKAALTTKGVPYPLARKGDPVVTIFLLDMEGTLVPMPFSQHVVFPRIVEYMPTFIQRHYPGEGELATYVKAASAKSEELKAAAEQASKENHAVPETNARVCALLHDHMRDATVSHRSLPYVKQFQGDVWEELMRQEDTAIMTRVFADFAEFVKARGARSAQGVSRVFIYSTGSVKLQEAVLAHTQEGDLMPYIAGLLDPSTMGSKLMPGSYTKIRSHISSVTGLRKDHFRIVFCTDSPSEASAADTSGSVESSILVVRPGNAWVNLDTFLAVGSPHIVSFAQLTDETRPVDYDALVAEVKDLIPPKRS